jgi:FecR protein
MGARRERDMVYRSSPEGGYGLGVSTDHVDASHGDRIDIPDAELLFRGHFARSGPDLVLTGQDGHRLVVTGYFASEKHPDLVAPNGAHLSGNLVDLLAGSPTPGHYAQAKTTLPPEAIGKVEKVVGHVTLIHNGVAGPLHVGDPVYKTDVVETAANSSCGIGFPDGTALDLVNNTRMALNEYNFEANNSAANGAIFSLVEGTFAFVAGQVAHTGEGMKINTPVATMGIRGTVGLFRSEPTVIQSNLGHVWSVFLHEDIDGSHHLGRIALIDQDPSSPTFGQVFYLLDSSEYIAYLEPQGSGLPPHVRLEPITTSKVFDDRHIFDDLGQIINAFQTGQVNPQSVPGTPGSGDDPSLLFNPLEQFLEEGGKPLFDFVPLTPGSSTPPQFVFPGLPVMGGLLPNTPNGPTSNGPNGSTTSSTVFIWNGTGAWPTAITNWNQGSAPNSAIDQVIIQSGTVTYDLTNTTISSLTVDPGATLNIVGGQLTTGGLTDNGTIVVDGDPPAFVVNGPATIGAGHLLQVAGTGTEVDFDNSTLDNHGVVAVQQHGTVVFSGETVTNEPGAVIDAVGGSVDFESTTLNNTGIIGAGTGGVITFENSIVNNSGGIIGTADVPSDPGGLVILSDTTIVGGMLITSGGEFEVVAAPGANMSVFDGSTTALTVAGFVAVLPGAQLELEGIIHVDAGGEIAVGGGAEPASLVINGNVTLETDGEFNTSIALSGGQIVGTGSAGNLENVNGVIVGYGQIGGGAPLKLVNDASGIVDADVANLALVLEPTLTVSNAGILEATDGGILDLLGGGSNSGAIQAEANSTVLISGSVENSGGIIAAGIGVAAAPSAGDGGDAAVFAATNALIASLEDLPPPPNSSDDSGSLDQTGDGGEELTSFVNLDNATIVGGTLETGINGFSLGKVNNTQLSFISSGVIQTVTNPDGSASTSILDGVHNEGFVLVNVGTTLELRDTITNDGEIVVGAGDGHANLVIDGSVTLTGDGTGVIWLSSPTASSLSGAADGDNALENVNNLIFGAGQIDGNLTLTNDTKGAIEAFGGLLSIDVNGTLNNAGTLGALNDGELDVHNTVDNCGGKVQVQTGGFVDFFLAISGGTATICDGKLEYGWSSDVTTDFDGSGLLVLDHQVLSDPNFATASFTGTVYGFGANDGILLSDLAFASNERAIWCDGVLWIFEGCTLEATIKIAGSYNANSFAVIDDGGKAEVVFIDDEWIGPSSENRSGTWVTGPDWTQGVPNAALNAIVDLPGTYTITTSGHQAANSLTIADVNAILTGCGSLTLGTLENHGTIKVTDEENLLIQIGSDSTNFGKIGASGGSLSLDGSGVQLLNYGRMAARDGGEISIDDITVINQLTNNDGSYAPDEIKSIGDGSDITFSDGAELLNYGHVVAGHGGKISFDGVDVFNEATPVAGDGESQKTIPGEIAAIGFGSTILFSDGAKLVNQGVVLAKDGGRIDFRHANVVNDGGGKIDADYGKIDIKQSVVGNAGFIEAVGLCSAIIISCDLLCNTGTVLAKDAGAVEVTDSKVFNRGAGEIEATDCRSIISFCHDKVSNKDGGEILATDFGTITFDGDKIFNKHDSTIEASAGGLIKIEYSEVTNKHGSFIWATDGGIVTLANDCVTNTGDSTIEARGHHSTVNLDQTWINNDGGTIAAIGCDAVVNLVDATIVGGTLETRHGGTIEVVATGGDNATVLDGSHGQAVTVDAYVLVETGANLELKGTIHNEGMIEVDGRQTDLVIDGTVTLDGHGTVMLDNADRPADQIVGGDGEGNTLHNVDNTIEGAGNIGTGNEDLWLVNESCGKIDANSCEQTLTLDTGRNQITNAGTLAASYGGILDVESSVDNAGGSIKVSDGGFADFEKSVTGGTATIHGGTLEFDAASNVNVTFDNTSGYGELILGDVRYFSGEVFDFAGKESEHPSLANTDEIDLAGINRSNISFCENGDNAEILINQGSIRATITLVDFNFEDLGRKSDGSGGTIIYDPPAADSINPSVSIGGAGNDTFVFHPGEGAQTINNFNPQNETIELDHFANIENMQELAAAITPDAQGNAVIELGHGDSVAIPGVSATFLQQHLQSLVHLH